VGDSGKWDVNKSWHAQYKDSAYVYVGGLPYDLSEGDIIVIFSQFGEIVDVNMPREKDTGKPKGFAFIAYEDQRSTVLAVDNFNGAKVLGRTLRCDHCASFHEEQEKDADALPEHVTRKLSDKELEQKKADISRRNEELEEAAASKAELFSHGRGTAETEREHDEYVIRQGILQSKEAEATAKRMQHIDAVLARRKGDHAKVAAEEARLKEQRERRRREREREMREAVEQSGATRKRGDDADEAAVAAEAAAAAAEDTSAESRWERMMAGGGEKRRKKHKKEKHHHRDRKRSRHDDSDSDGGDRGGSSHRRHASSRDDDEGGKKPGEGISVDETNRLRLQLGMKPLLK
jgi:RNA-binding motif X-linked protein 2